MTSSKTDQANTPLIVHGSCVAIGGHGVLLTGPSGSGKSDCALRLLDDGAMLVSDDSTCLTPDPHSATATLTATAPATIKGLLEIRGLGIVRWDSVDNVPLRLVINACDGTQVSRMPDLKARDMQATFADIMVPQLQFDLRHAATPAKIRATLAVVTGAKSLSE